MQLVLVCSIAYYANEGKRVLLYASVNDTSAEIKFYTVADTKSDSIAEAITHKPNNPI